jgi:hypothetical protein
VAHKIISKAEAIKRGLPTYFTGKPCPNGHIDLIYVNGRCRTCKIEGTNKSRAKAKAAKTGNKAAKSKAVVSSNSEPLSGEVLNGDWKFYSDKVTAALRAGAESMVERIVEAGTLLIEAKDKVPHGDWGKLVADLPVSERTVQMLMAVAANPILSDPKHASDLPPHWYTLYQLTKVPERVLLAKIENHTINLKTERKDIAAITGARHPKTKLRRRSKADERAIEEINRLNAHIDELEAARDNSGFPFDSEVDDDREWAEGVARALIMTSKERAELVLHELQRQLAASEAA